jgi:hypothetical protein
MMPPGSAARAPALFRIFARNPALGMAADAWGHYLLGRRFSLTRRQRELVIDRVCARCGDEYEWGLHIAHWASRVGLSDAEIAALAMGRPMTRCGRNRRPCCCGWSMSCTTEKA